MRLFRSRALLAVVLSSALALVAPAEAQKLAQPADVRAIQAVITGQLSAFQKDDASAAFTFASQGVHDTFGDAVTFALMVQNQYPMVYRPKNYQFEAALEVAEGLIQGVLFEDEFGQLTRALYLLQKEKGGWKVGGVYLIPLDDSQDEQDDGSSVQG